MSAEKKIRVRGRSVGGPRYRGVIKDNGSQTTSLLWTTTEVVRELPESVYLECKADRGLVLVNLSEPTPEPVLEADLEAARQAGPVDLSQLTEEQLFEELERRSAAQAAAKGEPQS